MSKAIDLLFHDPSLEDAEDTQKLSAILQRIVDMAAARGVSIQIELDEDGIHVPDLFRQKTHKNGKAGDGVEVLRQVCAVADEFKLVTHIEYMADEPKLGELYSSCGFKPYANHDDPIINMRRSPG